MAEVADRSGWYPKPSRAHRAWSGACQQSWQVKLNQKGQATLTDTMYFLIIVSGLCAFMYGFSGTYGSVVGDQINNQYITDFSSSALKTIISASVPRNPAEIGRPDTKIDYDYIMTMVKEEYAVCYEKETDPDCSEGPLPNRTKKQLKEVIKKVMAPVADSYDYFFYIYQDNDSEMVFFMAHLTNAQQFCQDSGNYVKYAKLCEIPEGENPHIDAYCTFSTSTDFFGPNGLESAMRQVNRISRSSSTTVFAIPASSETGSSQLNGRIELIMWPAAKLDIPEEWGCSQFVALEGEVID